MAQSLTYCPDFWDHRLSPFVVSEFLNEKNLTYFRNYEIGCRDLWTLKLLKSHGINAYFSGCLTLTVDHEIKSMREEGKKRENVLIIDLHPKALKFLPTDILTQAEIITHNFVIPLHRKAPEVVLKILRSFISQSTRRRIDYLLTYQKSSKIPMQERLKKAEEVVRKISEAKLVMTSRLHAALPALALNTPVLLVHENLHDPRFSGLLDFLNYYDVKSFIQNIDKIDIENMDNPKKCKLMEIKANLIKRISAVISD